MLPPPPDTHLAKVNLAKLCSIGKFILEKSHDLGTALPDIPCQLAPISIPPQATVGAFDLGETHRCSCVCSTVTLLFPKTRSLSPASSDPPLSIY